MYYFHFICENMFLKYCNNIVIIIYYSIQCIQWCFWIPRYISVGNKTIHTCSQVYFNVLNALSFNCLYRDHSGRADTACSGVTGTGPHFVCVLVGEHEMIQKYAGKAPAFLHLLCKTFGCAVVVSWGARGWGGGGGGGVLGSHIDRQESAQSCIHTKHDYSTRGPHVNLFTCVKCCVFPSVVTSSFAWLRLTRVRLVFGSKQSFPSPELMHSQSHLQWFSYKWWLNLKLQSWSVWWLWSFCSKQKKYNKPWEGGRTGKA